MGVRVSSLGADGALSDWNPNVKGTVNTLLASGNSIYVGGNFSSVGNSPRGNFAIINVDGTLE